MATTNYTLRVDDADKQKAEQVFKELGMTFATGINVYIKAVSRQLKIPFELALNPQVMPSTSITCVPKEEKINVFIALDGILAGHVIDLDEEKCERILSK